MIDTDEGPQLGDWTLPVGLNLNKRNKQNKAPTSDIDYSDSYRSPPPGIGGCHRELDEDDWEDFRPY